MRSFWNIIYVFIIPLLALVSCEDETVPDKGWAGGKAMTFLFRHPSSSEPFRTRVTTDNFEAGDRISLFVKEADKPLEISGNTVDNEMLEFDGNNWHSRRDLYWSDGEYEAFALYPRYDEIRSVSDLMVRIATDQTADPESGRDGYSQSDILYASSGKTVASDSPVRMQFRHLMSKITIRIVKGSQYEGDLPENMELYLHNMLSTASIDLTEGVVTGEAKAARTTVKSRRVDATTFSAVVIPQRLETNAPLIEVITGETSLLYEGKILFKSGVHYIYNFIISRNPEQSRIYVSGEQNDWN